MVQPKPDLVQVQEQDPINSEEHKEDGNANPSHEDEGIAGEEPDEDFEFGDQTEAELTAISQ